jgi:hypothetical protein
MPNSHGVSRAYTRALLQEHQRTHRAFRESPNEYEELKLERQRAREEDGQAQVSAFRAGGKDPGTRKEDALV